MAIPKECKMPDLSYEDEYPLPLIGYLIIQLLSGGDKKLSPELGAYRRSFVRLVDHAWNEYYQAKNELIKEIKRDKTTYMMEFTNHIETCFNVIKRLSMLMKRINNEESSPMIPDHLKDILDNKTIIDIRNTVEHLDERIQNRKIPKGRPIMLTVGPNADSLLISKYEIRFEELALVLERMREIALYILTVKRA